MKYIPLLLCILILFTSADAFDETRARAILDTIASPSFDGRRAGTAGAEATEDFLAWHLSDYKVYPGGTEGYFQDVPLLVTQDISASLSLQNPYVGRVDFTLGVDFTVVTHSGSGHVSAPVVIVGYGYDRPDKNRNDYDSVDVTHKVVLIIRGTPDSPYDFEEDFSRRKTLAWAKEHGASAILFYQGENPVNGAAIPGESYDPHLPMLYVGDRMLRLLLDGTGYSADTYKDKIKTAPFPLDTGKRVTLSTDVRRTGSDHARNVLGFVYGTDPALRNEVIVVGAHMDHIGHNAHGVVYPGADDNGSGTAIVSELAHTFAEHPMKRSLLILHFTGEEDGLLGSDYWVHHPSIPLTSIVGMVNLDMEGSVSGSSVAMNGGELFGFVWNEYVNGLDSTARSHIKFRREDGHGASDYASFMQAGIPTLAFWSRGPHPFYHHYDDEARFISDSALAAVGNRAEDFIRFLGNHAGGLKSYADSLKLTARLAQTVDLPGFSLDASVMVPTLTCPVAAWMPSRNLSFQEAVRRTSELRTYCEANDIAAANLKDALQGDRSGQKSLFIGMDAYDVSARSVAEVGTLMRQGLSVIRLPAANPSEAEKLKGGPIDEARKNGAYALVPFDFATRDRVAQWKKQALVYTDLKDFAAAPEAVRQGLLSSDALLILEVSDTPTKEQIEAIRPGWERYVHLSFAAMPYEYREARAWHAIKAMYDAGLTRDEILLLTGGNLRRFFDL
jgi:aminopeptidase YwaD